MKQTGFEWAEEDVRNVRTPLDIGIDPETRGTVVDLMARAMLALLTAMEVPNDER